MDTYQYMSQNGRDFFSTGSDVGCNAGVSEDMLFEGSPPPWEGVALSADTVDKLQEQVMKFLKENGHRRITIVRNTFKWKNKFWKSFKLWDENYIKLMEGE